MSQEYEEADCRMEDDSTNDDRKVRENGTTEEAEVEEQRRPKPDFSKGQSKYFAFNEKSRYFKF